MTEILEPVLSRQAMIERQTLLPTGEWVRWLDQLRRLLALTQADLAALAALVAALVQPQTTTLTVAVSGASVLTFPAMAPAGAQVVGVTWRVAQAFTGTLTGLTLGDSTVQDRWGTAAPLTAGTAGGSAGWHGQGGFTVGAAYTVVAAPGGGGFGATGALTVQATWWPALLPPP